MRPLTVFAIVLMVSGLALAQRGATIVFGSRPQPQMHQHHFDAPIFLGGAWYPGYGTEVVPAVPQVIVLQTPAPAPPIVKEDPRPIAPLMIEFQGGQYVRSDRNEKPVQLAIAHNTKPTKAEPVRTEIPAVLIFRDGHREQIREYTIVDGAIYAHGDYWADGFWNKKIMLSALDVRETLAANQASGSH